MPVTFKKLSSKLGQDFTNNKTLVTKLNITTNITTTATSPNRWWKTLFNFFIIIGRRYL